MERIELSSSVWKTEVLPLNDIRTVGKQGLEPRPPGPEPGALTLTPHPAEVEMAGIEPAAATLARRARYLSCHPHGQASAAAFTLGLWPAVSWCSHYGRVNSQARTKGMQGQQESNLYLAGFGDRMPIRWLIPR